MLKQWDSGGVRCDLPVIRALMSALTILILLCIVSCGGDAGPLVLQPLGVPFETNRPIERTGPGVFAFPALSSDGRYLAFAAMGSSYLSGGADQTEILVRDRQIATFELISVDSNEVSANESSSDPFSPRTLDISGDGRRVAFTSKATNLVSTDSTNGYDIFVRDRSSGVTERVSIASNGDEANGNCFGPSISDDGKFVAFYSGATNLVADDTNAAQDVFVRSLQSQTTIRVSVAAGGAQANGNSQNNPGQQNNPGLSSNGRFVVFQSDATNLVAADTNSSTDIFVRDLGDSVTERVSVSSDEIEGNEQSWLAAISGNGRFVVFLSSASNLVPSDANGNGADLFVRDRVSGTTERIALGTGYSGGSNRSLSLSGNGGLIVFDADNSDLVPLDTNGVSDIFVVDRNADSIARVSIGIDNNQSNGASMFPAISGDGAYVSFESSATNLVGGASGVFVAPNPLSP
ncbi:MAG: PD40 domain-containing protein [Chrysiogenetes bacterium]|nr:PD40 domain-containing protein [Chrysiogenetes bacterium]